MIDKNDVKLIDQRFFTLGLDSALLLHQSKNSTPVAISGALARAATLNLIMLVECAANSCISSLALSSRLVDELDKLPPIAKLDYFIMAHKNTHIDRGCSQHECLADILKLRDHIVHPKPKNGVLDMDAEYGDYGATKTLKIPYDTRVWTYETAKAVKVVVLNFLKSYFNELCEFDIGRSSTILLAREKRIFFEQKYGSYLTIPPEDFQKISTELPEMLSILDLRPNS
jgi:hypothetical protein